MILNDAQQCIILGEVLAWVSPRGNTLLEICTTDIRISRISAGYQRYNKRISRENCTFLELLAPDKLF